MPLEPSDIENIAHLARLKVSSEDVQEVTRRIGDILELIDKMQAVDTSSLDPLAHPMDATQRLRADQVSADNERDRLQELAPASEDGLYLVPRVIE